MAFREVRVNEIREVLQVWLGVTGLPAPGYRRIAAHCGVDRKTVRRYVAAAQAAGLRRGDSVDALDDELIGVVAEAVRPVRPHGHGAAWEQLVAFEDQIKAWVAGEGDQRPLTITKIHTLLTRKGCVVPYRTLHRFASERCGFGRKDTTVRVADGDPRSNKTSPTFEVRYRLSSRPNSSPDRSTARQVRRRSPRLTESNQSGQIAAKSPPQRPSRWSSAVTPKTQRSRPLSSSCPLRLQFVEPLPVGEGGLEPPRPEGHWHLKPARLPFRHSPGKQPMDHTTVVAGCPNRLGSFRCRSGAPHPASQTALTRRFS